MIINGFIDGFALKWYLARYWEVDINGIRADLILIAAPGFILIDGILIFILINTNIYYLFYLLFIIFIPY